MKKYIFIMVVIMVFTINFVGAQNNNLDFLGKVIYIDPGHGGNDPGAMYKNLKESNLNLKISYKLKKLLEQKGSIVYLTRYGDYNVATNYAINQKRSDLIQRAYMINKSKCDLFISVHLNSTTNSSWFGAQVYYSKSNKNNKLFAKILQNNLKKSLHTYRNIKKGSNLYLLQRIHRPGVLVEVGFLSNPSERYLMKTDTYQQKFVNIVSKSVNEYLN